MEEIKLMLISLMKLCYKIFIDFVVGKVNGFVEEMFCGKEKMSGRSGDDYYWNKVGNMGDNSVNFEGFDGFKDGGEVEEDNNKCDNYFINNNYNNNNSYNKISNNDIINKRLFNDGVINNKNEKNTSDSNNKNNIFDNKNKSPD